MVYIKEIISAVLTGYHTFTKEIKWQRQNKNKRNE